MYGMQDELAAFRRKIVCDLVNDDRNVEREEVLKRFAQTKQGN